MKNHMEEFQYFSYEVDGEITLMALSQPLPICVADEIGEEYRDLQVLSQEEFERLEHKLGIQCPRQGEES